MASTNLNIPSPVPESFMQTVEPGIVEKAPIVGTSRAGQLDLLNQVKANPGALANPFINMLGVSLTGVFMYQGIKAMVTGEAPPLAKNIV